MQNLLRLIHNDKYSADSSYHFPREEMIIYFTLKHKRIWIYEDIGNGKTNMGEEEWKKSSIFAVEFNIQIIEVQILDCNCMLKTKSHKGPISSYFRLQLHGKDQGSQGAY